MGMLRRMGQHPEAVEKFDQAFALKPMAELLQDDPLLQQRLQAYLKGQRRQALDTDVARPQPHPTARGEPSTSRALSARGRARVREASASSFAAFVGTVPSLGLAGPSARYGAFWHH